MASVNIYQVASDGSLTNVTGTTIEVAVGDTIELIGGGSEAGPDRWVSNGGSAFSISWTEDAKYQCYVTGQSSSGSSAYSLYLYDTQGNYDYVMIKVTGGGSSSYVAQIFCQYDGTFYEDGNTITVPVGTTLDFEAWVMLMPSATRDTAGVYWSYSGGNKGYLTKQSSDDLTATYYAQAAGTQTILLISKTDTSKSAAITITVTGGTTKTIDHILAIYGDQGYTSGFTITVEEGASFTLTGYAVFSDNTIDSEMGVDHVLESGQTCISLDSEDRTTGEGQYTALAAGQTTIWLMSVRDYSKELAVTVIVTGSSPVLSGIQVTVDQISYTDDFGIDLLMSETSKIFSAVSIDQNGEVFNYNNCAFTLMSGEDYVGLNTYSSAGVIGVRPKAAGKALLKAYCTDNEDLNILIVITVVEDASQTGGYAAYIYTGSTWEEFTPYIYDGTAWEEYIPDICTDGAWTTE